MAAADRPPPAPVAEQLRRQPDRFEFFQAVRMLLLEAARAAGQVTVGGDTPPEREPVRFRAHVSAAFPRAGVEEAAGREQAELAVNFMGLTGPSGVLPQHFTSLLIELRRANDQSLAAFQDVFNHRLIALFYRAWEKYRFPIGYERGRVAGGAAGEDFTHTLRATSGFGLDALLGRLALDDEFFVFFGGHFGRQAPCAAALEQMIGSYFETSVQVEQFVGHWLALDPRTQTRLDSAEDPQRAAAALGRNVVVGERVWDVQSRFRVRLGPLTFAQYLRLLPDGGALTPLAQIVRSYAGVELDFDVQLVLRADEAPECRLGGPDGGARLGWTTFVRAGPLQQDVDAAGFAFDTIHIEAWPGAAAGATTAA